ncbi:MAG: hypothetical protein ACYTG1_07505 [Planctomycetota bacterium]|jgi:hypothetical protein
MTLTGRRMLLALAVIVVAMGIVIWIEPDTAWMAIVVAACGMVMVLVLVAVAPAAPGTGRPEPDDIDKLGPQRRRELIRGTSMHLREMNYRYSVRPDGTESADRRCFSAEVNTVRLGFVPAVITDNTTDRQGYGYIAFVFDGHRWRGPGLPCPDGQAEAVRHAARCVSPLATEEETRW